METTDELRPARDPQWNWNGTDSQLRWWEFSIDEEAVLNGERES